MLRIPSRRPSRCGCKVQGVRFCDQQVVHSRLDVARIDRAKRCDLLLERLGVIGREVE